MLKKVYWLIHFCYRWHKGNLQELQPQMIVSLCWLEVQGNEISEGNYASRVRSTCVWGPSPRYALATHTNLWAFSSVSSHLKVASISWLSVSLPVFPSYHVLMRRLHLLNPTHPLSLKGHVSWNSLGILPSPYIL